MDYLNIFLHSLVNILNCLKFISSCADLAVVDIAITVALQICYLQSS